MSVSVPVTAYFNRSVSVLFGTDLSLSVRFYVSRHAGHGLRQDYATEMSAVWKYLTLEKSEAVHLRACDDAVAMEPRSTLAI